MIPGIVSVLIEEPEAVAITGTVLDFVNGDYYVDGVAYAVTDLLEAESGFTFTAGDIEAGRGLLVSSVSGTVLPKAKGPLLDKLKAAHTGLIDFEDVEDYYGGLCCWKTASAVAASIYASFGDNPQLDFASGTDFATFTNVYRTYGLNRVVWTIGTADDAAMMNGLGLDGSTPVNHSTFFTSNTITNVYPFGLASENGQIDGYVRKLEIFDPVASTDLQALSALTTPTELASVNATSITSTSVTMTFTGGTGSSGTQYLIGAAAMGTNDTWQALAGSGVISGLTPSTSYQVAVRSWNLSGPGGGDYDNFSTTA